MPSRPVCRSDLGGHDAGQPAAAVVRRDGLRAAVRLAPDRAGPHWACRRDLRHDPPQAPEDRRARALSMLWTDFCAGTPPGRLDPIRSAFSNTKLAMRSFGLDSPCVKWRKTQRFLDVKTRNPHRKARAHVRRSRELSWYVAVPIISRAAAFSQAGKRFL